MPPPPLGAGAVPGGLAGLRWARNTPRSGGPRRCLLSSAVRLRRLSLTKSRPENAPKLPSSEARLDTRSFSASAGTPSSIWGGGGGGGGPSPAGPGVSSRRTSRDSTLWLKMPRWDSRFWVITTGLRGPRGLPRRSPLHGRGCSQRGRAAGPRRESPEGIWGPNLAASRSRLVLRRLDLERVGMGRGRWFPCRETPGWWLMVAAAAGKKLEKGRGLSFPPQDPPGYRSPQDPPIFPSDIPNRLSGRALRHHFTLTSRPDRKSVV